MIEDLAGDLLSSLGTACVIFPFLRDMAAIRKGCPRWDDGMAYVAGSGLLAVGNGLSGRWPMCAAAIILTVIHAVLWSRRRRKKRRTLAALGAKSRARIAAMVATLRERAKPRPVLRPQRSPA